MTTTAVSTMNTCDDLTPGNKHITLTGKPVLTFRATTTTGTR